jgi:hypothetical protein
MANFHGSVRNPGNRLLFFSVATDIQGQQVRVAPLLTQFDTQRIANDDFPIYGWPFRSASYSQASLRNFFGVTGVE